MDHKEYELLEACKICKNFNPGYIKNGYGERDCGGNETSVCLGKDRAIIVLLDRLLKNLEQ